MSFYKELSDKRKAAQQEGTYPEWFTTGGYQMFEDKYLYQASGFKEQAQRIASTAASYLGKHEEDYTEKFFNLIWKGWLSCSTPILSNMGTERGMPVSCSGTVVEDSVEGFYDALRENALLTQNGFGTAAYLGNVRPRGSAISKGGKAAGVLPVLQDFVTMAKKVSQGNTRRGSIGNYLPIDHGDFWEVVHHLEKEPADCNIGWTVSDTFIERLENGDEEAVRRYKRTLKVKMVTGKGYFYFVDKVNRHNPEAYKRQGFKVLTSQLCSEISLYADKEHSFTCVLSSMNLAKYNEWKDTDAIEVATIFLDCVAQDFIKKGSKVSGLEKAVRYTEKGRSLGLGVCGLHTLFQQENITFESMEAHLLNTNIFKQLNADSLKASQWLAKELGEPLWCKGLGIRNTHRLAIAPTKSTALIMGGVSEGINPDPAMAFVQAGAGGDIDRLNPTLLSLMKSKDVYNQKNIQEIIDSKGSVQAVGWLDEHEKAVFKTAFEIDQRAVLRLGGIRGKEIDQWQSLNLFFSAEEDPAYIAQIHREAFLDEKIRGLYYCYSKSGIAASKDECEACQ